MNRQENRRFLENTARRLRSSAQINRKKGERWTSLSKKQAQIYFAGALGCIVGGIVLARIDVAGKMGAEAMGMDL